MATLVHPGLLINPSENGISQQEYAVLLEDNTVGIQLEDESGYIVLE